jgi:1-aminocyclopropane-1-carboxylate deaminase/D-cysteine desulfhydrase-like pyridoxal-dependent ACC family enzyme
MEPFVAAEANTKPRTRSEHPLASMLSRSTACLRLAHLPTPVERATWLDSTGAQAWIKRDDLSSPLYGGGKVRKLEWSLANPPFDDMRPIVSMGGIGSNHLVALALFLGALDRRLHALVFEQPLTEHARTNLAVMASRGTQFWYVPARWQLPLAWLGYQASIRSRRGEVGHSMAPGGSTALGCFGFVTAAFELAEQIEAGLLPRPDTVFVTGGTGGATAGLVLGFALAGVRTHVRSVSAVEPILYNRATLTLKLRTVLAELNARGLRAPGLNALLRSAGVTWSIDHAQVGDRYGAPTQAGEQIAARAAEHGIVLDPTYTAKCAAALRSSQRSGTALFWHTHGSQDLSRHVEDDWRERLPRRLRQALARWEARTGAD